MTCSLFDFRFDINGDNVLDFMKLKHMMEILGPPQTYIQLKDMIKGIDDDFDGSISFTGVLNIHNVAAGEQKTM